MSHKRLLTTLHVIGGFFLGVLSTALLLIWLLGPSTFDGLPTLLVERL